MLGDVCYLGFGSVDEVSRLCGEGVWCIGCVETGGGGWCTGGGAGMSVRVSSPRVGWVWHMTGESGGMEDFF